MVFEFVMGKELSVDVDERQQYDSDVFLLDPKEFQKLRNHVFAIKGHGQQAFLRANATTGVC